jgi:hypothetical protein
MICDSDHGTAQESIKQESIKALQAARQKNNARAAKMITIQATAFPTRRRFRNLRPD